MKVRSVKCEVLLTNDLVRCCIKCDRDWSTSSSLSTSFMVPICDDCDIISSRETMSSLEMLSYVNEESGSAMIVRIRSPIISMSSSSSGSSSWWSPGVVFDALTFSRCCCCCSDWTSLVSSTLASFFREVGEGRTFAGFCAVPAAPLTCGVAPRRSSGGTRSRRPSSVTCSSLRSCSRAAKSPRRRLFFCGWCLLRLAPVRNDSVSAVGRRARK